ncbi:MAG: TlpA family protein disulfide reductase [Acidobacteria bacterium]|nr:TlpA family protein disulfide reductase [Acidobacteriota bacterium]
MPTSRADRAVVALMALAFAALVFVLKDAFVERLVEVGDKAPNFSIVADNGRRMTRSEFGGRLLVLNFWATWCPPCVSEFPSLNAFAEQVRNDGVVVMGISVDRNESAYRGFLQQMRPTFVTARDPAADISSEYGTFKYPETYVISHDGKVLQKHIGERNWTDPRLISEIKALL